MNDQPDPLVLIGGPLTIQDLVKRYASLKGWQRVNEIAPQDNESLASWSRMTARRVLEMSKPGDKILIFLPERLYQGWLKTLEASGRHPEIPLCDLAIARQIATLYRWIAALDRALESKPRSTRRLARLLRKFKVLFLQRHARNSSPVPRQAECRRAHEVR
jgi:hypothetical protein